MAAGIIDLIMSFMSMWAIDGFMYRGSTEKLGLFAAAVFGLQFLAAALTLIFVRRRAYRAHMTTDIRRRPISGCRP
jgi:ABC-type bacteriocin/lantibiotic exporter with double-glycine peptidase domain